MDQVKAQPTQDSKLHFLDYWRIIRIRKTVILAVFALVVMTSTLVTLVGLEKKYSSVAKIKVERDQSDIAGLQQLQQISSPYDPYFIQTEFEVIQSELILQGILTNNIAPAGSSKPFILAPVYHQRYGVSTAQDLLT